MILAQENIFATPITEISKKSQISGVQVGKIAIHGIYRPPDSSLEEDADILDYINGLNQDLDHIIMGDLNYPGISWSTMCSRSEQERRFLDTVLEANLRQLISEPTHTAGNTLDLLLTSDRGLMSSVAVNAEEKMSDHYLIEANVDCKVRKRSNNIKTRVWCENSLAQMRAYIGQMDWDSLLTSKSTEEAWSTFKHIFVQAQDEFIPLKSANPKFSTAHDPWINRYLLRKLRRKQKLWKKYKETGEMKDFHEHRATVKSIKKEVKEAKKKFEQSLIKERKKFYNLMKRKTKGNELITTVRDEEGIPLHSDPEKSTRLNEYFCSVFSAKPNPYAGENQNKINIPVYQELNDIDLHPMHIKGALHRMKQDSSPGPDGILPKAMYHLRNELVTHSPSYLTRVWTPQKSQETIEMQMSSQFIKRRETNKTCPATGPSH